MYVLICGAALIMTPAAESPPEQDVAVTTRTAQASPYRIIELPPADVRSESPLTFDLGPGAAFQMGPHAADVPRTYSREPFTLGPMHSRRAFAVGGQLTLSW